MIAFPIGNRKINRVNERVSEDSRLGVRKLKKSKSRFWLFDHCFFSKDFSDGPVLPPNVKKKGLFSHIKRFFMRAKTAREFLGGIKKQFFARTSLYTIIHAHPCSGKSRAQPVRVHFHTHICAYTHTRITHRTHKLTNCRICCSSYHLYYCRYDYY